MPALRGGDCGSVAHTTAKRPQHAPNPRSGQRQPTKPAWVMAEGSVVKLARDGVQRVCKEGVRDRIMVHLCHSAGMSGSEVNALKFDDSPLDDDAESGSFGVEIREGWWRGGRRYRLVCTSRTYARSANVETSTGKTSNGSHVYRPEQVLATSEERTSKFLPRFWTQCFPGARRGLLHGLCSVLVQDAAVLRRKHPRHSLFTLGAFSGPAFEAFARRITAQPSVQGISRNERAPDRREDGLPSLKQEMDRLRRER